MALAYDGRTGMEELREAIQTGRLVDLRVGDAEADDPGRGSDWATERTVSAALLTDLLTEGNWPRQPRGLRLAGARITGKLDLEAAELACPVLMRACWFELPVELAEASIITLRLPECRLPFLQAHHLKARGNVELDEGFVTDGMVFLAGAHIGGSLHFSRATLTNPDKPALFADGLTVEESMICREGFSAQGEVRLIGARIGGSLELDGATLNNPGRRALTADGITLGGNLFCRNEFSAKGEVRLAGAHIGGVLDFDDATLINPGARALNAGGLAVNGSMACRKGYSAQGEM